MSLTEDEAKTKWCPFVRTMLYHPGTADNPAANRREGNLNCIASECMAWRWDGPRKAPHGVEISNSGYCGLAGTP